MFKRSIAFLVCLVSLCICLNAYGQGKASDKLFPIVQGGRWGYINKTGNFVIQPLFRQAYNFSGGLALVIVGNRVGYIDKTGKYVWKPTR
jgi:WG containing repeat